MPYLNGEGKTVISIFVDGLEVKFVHVSLKDKKIILHDVKTVNLVKRLEEKTIGAEMGAENYDVMSAIDSGGDKEEFAAPSGSDTNGEVIIGLLGEYPTAKYYLVYPISEPSVYYQQFEDNFGLSGSKLKKKLIDELAATRSVKPSIDSLEYVGAADGQVLSMIREDGMGLLTLIESVQDFLGRRVPKVQFIETSDVSLMNLVRNNYELGESEISIIVYVGSEFSRLIFMKGNSFFHFAPVISEGRHTSNIENTIYSRILLEQDSAGILHIDRIFLAGESHKIELKQFLTPQFAEAPIEYLSASTLDTTEFEDDPESIISEYAIPISAAMRALDTKNKNYYSIDLLPSSFREQQKNFKLAWHGYVLLLVIFLSTLFFTFKFTDQNENVRRTKMDLQKKQEQLAENQRLQGILDSLHGQNRQYESALAVYDSIVPNYNQWSKIFNHLTNSVEGVNSIWMKDIVSKGKNGFDLTGYSVYRQRIPRMANMFEKATLRSVDVENIRGKEVYKFLLSVDQIEAEE
jgi:hypothetical protein